MESPRKVCFVPVSPAMPSRKMSPHNLCWSDRGAKTTKQLSFPRPRSTILALQASLSIGYDDDYFDPSTVSADLYKPQPDEDSEPKVMDPRLALIRKIYGELEDEYIWFHRRHHAIESAKKMNMDESKIAGSLTYGEFNLETFQRALEAGIRHYRADKVYEKNDKLVFYDIGSGAGRVILAASLIATGDAKVCKGVEVVPGLHKLALEYAEDLDQALKEPENSMIKVPYEFVLSDFMSHDFRDADIVFAYCTTWTCYKSTIYLTDLTQALGDTLKFGAIAIIVDKLLFDEAKEGVGFELLEQFEGPNQDTGGSMVSIYRKVRV